MKDSIVIEKILASKPIFINEHKIDCKIAIPKDHITDGVNQQKNQKIKSNLNFNYFFFHEKKKRKMGFYFKII